MKKIIKNVESKVCKVSKVCAGSATILGISSLVFVVSCGDRAVQEGVFHDSIVSGLEYSTSSFTGITDESGTFEYRPSEEVTFKIGAITLGSARGDDVLTPLELANTESVESDHVINISRLLQTLDSDKNPDNGINITEDVRTSATVEIDVTVSAADFEANEHLLALIQASGSEALISEAEATAHLQQTLDDLGYNQLPDVLAGDNQTVSAGDEVTLQGQATDPDGFITDFSWTYEQSEGGPEVVFFTDEEVDASEEASTGNSEDSSEDDSTNAFTAFSERFTAPEVNSSTELLFTFTAEDNDGAESSAQVTITVNP